MRFLRISPCLQGLHVQLTGGSRNPRLGRLTPGPLNLAHVSVRHCRGEPTDRRLGTTFWYRYRPAPEGQTASRGCDESQIRSLTFDLIPPTLSGATAKTVRVPKKAKTARVTYRVTATDDVDGSVPVACQPRSGSRFKVGRTTVRCEATDSSANTAMAAFTVTVKRRR